MPIFLCFISSIYFCLLSISLVLSLHFAFYGLLLFLSSLSFTLPLSFSRFTWGGSRNSFSFIFKYNMPLWQYLCKHIIRFWGCQTKCSKKKHSKYFLKMENKQNLLWSFNFIRSIHSYLHIFGFKRLAYLRFFKEMCKKLTKIFMLYTRYLWFQ